MKQRFTTIFLVSDDHAETKFYSVKTRHVENLRKYVKATAIGLSALLLSLLLLVVLLKIANSEISKLNGNVTALKNDLKMLDSMEIKKKVNNIDENIGKINRYLIERGIFKSENSGGPSDDGTADIRVYEFYLNKTTDILNTIQNVPIGLPHVGEFKSFFGYRANPFSGRGSEFHKGLDIKGEVGEPVKCTAAGTVIAADYDGGYGKCVVIDHKNGLTTRFGHLSDYNVKQGDNVNAGDVVGFIGSTGRSTGPHLHYEIRYNNEFLNPQDFLNLK